MINAIINGIFSLVMSLINLILAPIDLLLNNIPHVSDATNGINSFVQIIKSAMTWAWDIVPDLTKLSLTGLFVTIAFFWSTIFAVKMLKMAWGWIQKIKFW